MIALRHDLGVLEATSAEVLVKRACALALCALALLVCAPLAAQAEPMVTSFYPAKQPHIAAHRTLPLGTVLILTNPRNGRTARVVVGGRGPFDRRRSLDVSHTIAKQLGFDGQGVTVLHAEVAPQ
jgi:Lytic transglycolase